MMEHNIFLVILGDFGPKKNDGRQHLLAILGDFGPQKIDGRQHLLVILGDLVQQKRTKKNVRQHLFSFWVILAQKLKQLRNTTFFGRFG